jgi:hypothetical protein
MEQFFQEFCDKVIAVDSSIRFIGIADGQYAITAATRQYTRIRWQPLLGKIDYTCSHYDKLLRATIPITDKDNHLCYIIIFTFDVETNNFHQIIMEKIIPIIHKNESQFLDKVNNLEFK